jgi:DNA polymerase-1
MELRAAAWIAGDEALSDELNSGRDFHQHTAAALARISVEQVTDDQRQAAKAVAFGSIYGMGAKGLVHALWSGYQIEISEDEAQQRLDRFFRKYLKLKLWCRSNAEQCEREGLIRIGCGRVVERRWEPGGLTFPQMCNLPIQGICADALMRAIILVNHRLQKSGIAGGLVAAVHDELLIEVAEGDAERAREILERSMVDAFVDTFPEAQTNGLAVARIGRTWADVK